MDQNNNLAEDNILDLYGQVIFSKRYDGVYSNQYFMYNYGVGNGMTNIKNHGRMLVWDYNCWEFGNSYNPYMPDYLTQIKYNKRIEE